MRNIVDRRRGGGSPTLGSDKISDSQWNKYRKFKKSLLDTTTTTTEGVPVKDWENLAIGDKVTSEALRSLEGVDEEGRAILEDGEYFEDKVQQEKLDNLVKNLNKFKNSKAVIFPKNLKKEVEDVLGLTFLNQLPESATGSEKIAYAKRKSGAKSDTNIFVVGPLGSETEHATRTTGEMVNYILDNYINNEKSTPKGLDVALAKERFLKSIKNNAYYILDQPELEKESITLRDIAIALYKNVIAGKFDSESRSGELGYSVNYYVNELMKKMAPYYFPANKMDRYDRSVGPELLDSETGKPLLVDINEATDLLVDAAEEFVWDVQLDTSDILGGQHSNIPKAFFEKLENLGLGKIGQLTILTEEQAKRLGTKEEVETLFEEMEDNKFSFSSNDGSEGIANAQISGIQTYGDAYKEEAAKKSSLRTAMEARDARKKIDDGAEEYNDSPYTGLLTLKQQDRIATLKAFVQYLARGKPSSREATLFEDAIEMSKRLGFTFKRDEAFEPTEDLSQEVKRVGGALAIKSPFDGETIYRGMPEELTTPEGQENFINALARNIKNALENPSSVLYNRRRDVTDVSNSHVYRKISLNSEMYSHTPSRSEVEQNLQNEYVATAELLKVIAEATTTLPEELQNEITESLLKNRFSKTTKGGAKTILNVLKKQLAKGQNVASISDREQALAGMIEKEGTEPIDSIGKFATLPLRLRAARRSLELMEGSKNLITREMNRVNKMISENEESLENNKKRLADLATGKRYDPDKVKKAIEIGLTNLIEKTMYNNLYNKVPTHSKKVFLDKLRIDKVYETLQAILRGGMAPEQMGKQELYDALEGQVSSADMFDGLEGEPQDNVTRALLAELLSKDSRGKARSMFAVEMRLSMDAPTRALKIELEGLRKASMSTDWKDISTSGILGKQIQEIKNVRKEQELLTEKIARNNSVIPVGEHLIKHYNDRVAELEDYLGSMINPEVAVGDYVDMLTLDEDGGLIIEKVKYMVSGEGYTAFVQKARRMKEIIDSGRFNISDAHRDGFARTYALIEKGLAKSYDATHTGNLLSHLESFSQVVSRTGDEESLMIASMINRLNTDLRLYGADAVRQGKSVAAAWNNLQKELRDSRGNKLTLEHIQEYLFDPFMAYVEGQPEITDLTGLAESFWASLKKEKFKIHNDDHKAKEKWMRLVTEIEVGNNKIRKIAKELNLPIEDSIKIMDPLLQKRTLYRTEIPIGALTLPRMLDMERLDAASNALTEGEGNIFNDIVTGIKEKLDKDDPLYEDDYNRNSFQSELSGWKLSEQISTYFLDPTLSDTRNPRSTGWSLGKKILSTEEVAEAWNNSVGGDVGARIYYTISELVDSNVSEKDFVKFGLEFLGQINQRANAVVRKNAEYKGQIKSAGENPNVIIYGKEVWSSLNSRDESVSMPSYFFNYNMMTEIDMRQMVAKMLMAHHFGRNQEKLNQAYDQLREKLESLQNEWNNIYIKVSDEPYPFKPTKVAKDLSGGAFNVQAFGKKFGLDRSMRKKITKDEYEKLKSLYTRILATRQAVEMQHAFAAHAKNQGSILSDERAAIETLQTVSSALVANPKSAIMNMASLYQVFQWYDLQPAGFKASLNILKRMPVEMLDTIMQSFGKNLFNSGSKRYGEEALAPIWTSMDQATSDRFNDAGAKGNLGDRTTSSSIRKFSRMLRTALGSGLKIPGVNNRVINMILNGTPGREKLADEGTLTSAPGSLSTFTLIPGASNVFSWLSNAMLKHTTLEVLNDLKSRVENAVDVLDQKGISPDDLDYELSIESMNYSNNLLGISFKDSAEVMQRIDRELANFGMSITKLAQDFRRRRKDDLDADPIEDKNKFVAAHIASTQITFDGTSAKARVLQTDKGMYASPLLGWSTSMAAYANRKFRGDSRDAIDPSNVDTYKAFGVFALSALGVGVPISLWVMRGSELYDEEFLGKDPGLGYVPPEAYLPFGLLFAVNDPAYRTLSLVERLGRTSSFGGLYQEMATNMVLGATGEQFQRDISNRIMMISLASNFGDAIMNYLSAIDPSEAETFVPEYSSVIRPLMNTIGLNNVIQMAQYSNNLLGTADFPLFSSEYKITNLLNQRNKLRAITKALGIETQKAGGGLSYRPNAMSIAIREMERSAYVGDRDSFLDAYRLALRLSTADDAKRDVADRFKKRNLRNGVSKYALGDTDWVKLLSVLDTEDRKSIEESLMKHSYYLQLIGGKPKGASNTTRVQVNDLRRKALL
jgi:hypothetical protein